MNYFIQRNGQEYGPYTLADLQRYMKSGEILPGDMCRSEGMSGLLPVSQIVGNIPAPAPIQQTVYGGAPAAAGGIDVSSLPKPPNLHWAVVLLLGVITCFLFLVVWIFVEAAFVKKIDPKSKAILWMVGSLVGWWVIPIVIAGMTGAANPEGGLAILKALGQLGGWVCQLFAIFGMKASLEEYYNSREPIGLQLNGGMVFFFAVFYFQYHFTEINERHKAMRVIA